MNKYTKLTAKRLNAIVELLEEGLKINTISELLEIHRNTYLDWYGKGESIFGEIVQETKEESKLSSEEKLFFKFYKETRKAKALFEQSRVKIIRNSRSFQAATFFLERSNSEDWQRNSDKKVQVEDVTQRESFADQFNKLYPNLSDMSPFEKAEFYKKTLTPEQLEKYRLGAENNE